MGEEIDTMLPSRHSNPFATCWTRPGALSFQFASGERGDLLVEQFQAAGGWGEIVGPHGSGKTTLLETLKPTLVAAGWDVSGVTLRNGERRLPPEFLVSALAKARPLVIVDGYEQLSRASRLLLRLRCWWRSAGLLVTSHASVGLPLVYRTQVTRQLAEQLVSTLTANHFSPIDGEDIAASHASCGSNLREFFFQLYERHEVLIRRRAVANHVCNRLVTIA